MIYLLAFLIIASIGACTWFSGFWGATLTFMNLVFAGMIATNFFEPIADAIEGSAPQMTYILDFLVLWGLFFFVFGLLRVITGGMSRFAVSFNVAVEMTGRSVMAISCVLVFLSFSMFTVHTAPMEPAPFGSFQKYPSSTNLVYGPDRLWMGFMQSRSRGGLAEFRNHPIPFQGNEHPDDVGKNYRVFDSQADFIFKYQARRQKLMEAEGILVNK